MTSGEKFLLITQNLDEVITSEDVRTLLAKDVPLKHYIGFEISGFIHLGSGLMSMLKIKDLQKAGVEVSVFLADWHTWINKKLGGANLDTLKRVAVRYFKEGMTAAALCAGADPGKISFILGSDIYHHNDEYWKTVVDVSKHTTLSRVLRSITIAGRKEGEGIDFAILMYPAMQVADIFIQGVSLAHAGMDQRKAHVIMRDVAGPVISQNAGLQRNNLKPVALHHHLLLGLGKPSVWPIPAGANKQELWTALKMSKSKPETCVFLQDMPKDIERKVMNAFCPEGEIEFNPVLDWTKHIVFPIQGKLEIERPGKFGGDVAYDSFEALEKDFGAKQLHPQDLKVAVVKSLIPLLAPARNYFASPEKQTMLEEMQTLVARNRE